MSSAEELILNSEVSIDLIGDGRGLKQRAAGGVKVKGDLISISFLLIECLGHVEGM